VEDVAIEYRFRVGNRDVGFLLGPAQRPAVRAWLERYRKEEPLQIETPALRLTRAPLADMNPQTTPPSYGVALDWQGTHVEISDKTVDAWAADLASGSPGIYDTHPY
jgi:hypothetical protein